MFTVYVEANDINKLKNVLQEKHAFIQLHNKGLKVRNLEASDIGILAHEHRIILFQLTKINPSLEDLFTDITDGKVDYVAKGTETE